MSEKRARPWGPAAVEAPQWERLVRREANGGRTLALVEKGKDAKRPPWVFSVGLHDPPESRFFGHAPSREAATVACGAELRRRGYTLEGK